MRKNRVTGRFQAYGTYTERTITSRNGVVLDPYNDTGENEVIFSGAFADAKNRSLLATECRSSQVYLSDKALVRIEGCSLDRVSEPAVGLVDEEAAEMHGNSWFRARMSLSCPFERRRAEGSVELGAARKLKV